MCDGSDYVCSCIEDDSGSEVVMVVARGHDSAVDSVGRKYPRRSPTASWGDQ